MIEITSIDSSIGQGNFFGSEGIEGGFSIDSPDLEFNFNIETGIGDQGGVQPQNSSIGGAAVDYMVDSKNSLIQKSVDIHSSYLGDDTFSFRDKMQLLEKTYSYQLEMTYYNTFMSQAMQKTDSLIQLK